MIRSRYISALAVAAMFGAANSALAADASAKSAPKATTAATAPATKPLCSELGHPQAGKLADKSTGMAKEHSASPVHQDCIPDAQASKPSSTNKPATSKPATTSGQRM